MSDRATRWAPAALVVLLALAMLPSTDVLELAGPPGAADAVNEALDELPPGANVLVGFDPDLGTYAEIRPTVRTLLADLLDRGATLALLSLTPEGRALALAERTRLLSAGVAAERVVDAGFVPGAEAALVALSRSIQDDGEGIVGAPIDGDLSLALVIGGNDIGPRSWVEQVEPRIEGLELIAVAPSVLLPELEPYLESGQLRALLGTPRDGAAYRVSVGAGNVQATDVPRPFAVLIGMLVAIGALGVALASRLGAGLRRPRGREAA
jgi:hypothetical protein